MDPIPRIISAEDWNTITAGISQRVKALNRFLWDIYHDQHILKQGIIPRKAITSNGSFRLAMMHMDVPGGVYITLSGIDIIRNEEGRYFVLEDNLRTLREFLIRIKIGP